MMNGNEMDMALSFILLLRFLSLSLAPRVFFAELAGRALPLLSGAAAGGIWSMLMREMEFEICLQFTLSFLLRSDCFVCLFSILVAGNSYGQRDYRGLGYISVRSSLYLSHIMWLRRRCILVLRFQNSLSARQ